MKPSIALGVLLLVVGAVLFLLISIFLGLIILVIGLIVIYFGRKAARLAQEPSGATPVVRATDTLPAAAPGRILPSTLP